MSDILTAILNAIEDRQSFDDWNVNRIPHLKAALEKTSGPWPLVATMIWEEAKISQIIDTVENLLVEYKVVEDQNNDPLL